MPTSFEREVERIFARYAQAVKAAAQGQNIEALRDLNTAAARERMVREFAEAMEDEMRRQSAAEARNMKWPVGDDEALERIFSVQNPYAAGYSAQHSAALVTEIDIGTRAAVNDIITSGFTQRRTVQDTARLLRGWTDREGVKHSGVIGLHPRDAKAVENYRAALKVAEVADADKRAARYADKLLRNRGANIARTETALAQTQGKLASWQVAKDQGLVLPTAMKRWLSAFDERTCPICGPLHKETVPLDSTFPGGYDGPPAHPQCRCDVDMIQIAPGSTWELSPPPSQRTLDRQQSRAADYRRRQQRRFRQQWRRVPT